MNKQVYCKDCVRLYFTKADQCDIPNPGLSSSFDFDKAVYGSSKAQRLDQTKINFAKSKLKYIHYTGGAHNKYIYGHPTELNINNDCLFYKDLPRPFKWLTPVFRFFHNLPV